MSRAVGRAVVAASVVVSCGGAAASDPNGVGVAVAVNSADVTTDAHVSGVTLTTPAVNVEAVTKPAADGATNTFGASATSGAGGAQNVGVAGSVGINVVTLNTTAQLAGAPVVTGDASNASDVTLAARSNDTNTATAVPGTGGTGAATGVGASVALNIVNDSTTAGLTAGSALAGAHDLTITADAVSPATTQARGGAFSADIAAAPVYALTTLNVNTTANSETGPALVLTGNYTATAHQVATVTTTATGEAQGDGALGVAVAQTYANHTVQATTHRDVTAAGTFSLTANGASAVATTATASSSTACASPASRPTASCPRRSSSRAIRGSSACSITPS